MFEKSFFDIRRFHFIVLARDSSPVHGFLTFYSNSLHTLLHFSIPGRWRGRIEVFDVNISLLFTIQIFIVWFIFGVAAAVSSVCKFLFSWFLARIISKYCSNLLNFDFYCVRISKKLGKFNQYVNFNLLSSISLQISIFQTRNNSSHPYSPSPLEFDPLFSYE